MKKYLICGATALLAGLFITSCTHDDLDSRSIIEQKTQNYDAAFKSLYGEIAPGHTWGFDIPDVEPSGIIPAESQAESRAFTRDANPNHKLWAGDYTSVPTPLTDAQKDLVRRYFQQNKNPQGISVTYSNFFVQQVYKGHTALSDANSDCTEKYTAGNGSTVYGSDQMDKLTAGIKEDHIYNFNHADYSGGDYTQVWTGEIRNNDPNDKVYQQDQIMLMENSSTDCFGFYNSEESGQYNDHYVIITGDAIMTWAKTESAKLSDAAKSANVAGMFFVGFDFESNKQAYNADGSLNVETNRYLVTFCDQNTPNAVKIPNSDRWATIGGADGYYSDWIVRITEGKKKINDGDNNNNQGGPTNTSYKKTLAKRHVLLDKGRIFCEDLSSVKDVKEDIDFNDVVFDAIVWYDYWVEVEKDDNGKIVSIIEYKTDDTHQNSLWADISLLATGATEQVKVGDKEVHGLFDKSVKTMVNTVGASSKVYGSYEQDPKTPINFQINLSIPKGITGSKEDYLKKHITLDDIPVTVYWNTNGAGRAAAYLSAGTVQYTTDEDGDIINVTGMTAPHKIKVPLGTSWPAERRNIQEGYPSFPQYVQSKTSPWDDKESFYLYEYNWNLLAHRDLARHKFFYSDETEIVDALLTDKYLEWGGWADFTLPNGVSKNYKMRIYGEVRRNGKNEDPILTVNGGWSQGVPFKDTAAGINIVSKLNNGCIVLEFTKDTIDEINKQGGKVNFYGKSFYINYVTIDPQ